MIRVRRNVWDLPRNADGWSDTLLWYARGVAAMKAKPLSDAASWRSYAAIHGIYPPLWEHYGYLTPGEAMPPQAAIDRYWDQCQHGTWYFLPWHRGYLAALEGNILAVIAQHGGTPPTDWALPYWNYFKPGQNDLPPEFASPDWPDGTGDNPLYVEPRWGPYSDGNVTVLLDQVDLDAMREPAFSSDATLGGSLGFGGPDTRRFEHGGRRHGAVESQPHDVIHGLVGGEDANNPAPPWWGGPHLPGLMSSPPTAGLDPIFYLHHANIDRLWASWAANGHADPTDDLWRKGPASIGQRIFSMPKADGSGWDYTPADMVDPATLGYDYDELDPTGAAAPGVRSAVRGLPEEELPMTDGKDVEIVGASERGLPIVGTESATDVRLDKQVRQKVVAARVQRSAAGERVLLNLENVTGLSDATIFKVYLNLPDGSSPDDHPELLAGSIGLFGVRSASDGEDEHGGQGLDYVLDVTKIVNALSLQGKFDVDHVAVRVVPLRPVEAESRINIGRISIAVQGA